MKPYETDFAEEEEEALGKMEQIQGKKGDREFSMIAEDGSVMFIEPFKTMLTKKGQFEYGAAVYKLGYVTMRRIHTFRGKTLSAPSPQRLTENLIEWLEQSKKGEKQWLKKDRK